MQSRLSQHDSQHAVLPVSDDAPFPQSSAQIPSADEGGSSTASEMGDVLSTPSLPLAVSILLQRRHFLVSVGRMGLSPAVPLAMILL